MAPQGTAGRWVCLDVGETLIDESRVWATWADVLGITRLTFMASFGAMLALGRPFDEVFAFLGVTDRDAHRAAFVAQYGGFQEHDLYPDVRSALDALHRRCRVAIVANQPPERTAELRALDIDADVMAMSGELGVHKPAPEFFARALELMGGPNPADVAYVGDRLDNDVRPAAAAGMRPVWLRRGPWAFIEKANPPADTFVVDSLTELAERIDEVWQ